MSIKVLNPPLALGLVGMKKIFGNHIKVGNTIMGKKLKNVMGDDTKSGKGRRIGDTSGGAGTYAPPSVDKSGPNAGPLSYASNGAPGSNLRSPGKRGVMSGSSGKK